MGSFLVMRAAERQIAMHIERIIIPKTIKPIRVHSVNFWNQSDTSLAYLLKPKDFIPHDPHTQAIEKELTHILRNWDDIRKPKVKDYRIKKAKEYKQLPAAQEILKRSVEVPKE